MASEKTTRYYQFCGPLWALPVSVGTWAPQPWLYGQYHTPDNDSPEALELQGWAHGVGGRETANHKAHLCHPSGSAKSGTFLKLAFCNQNPTEPQGDLKFHSSKRIPWQTRQGWKRHSGCAEYSCLELAMFPQFPWATLKTLVGKGWGAGKKRGREDTFLKVTYWEF